MTDFMRIILLLLNNKFTQKDKIKIIFFNNLNW